MAVNKPRKKIRTVEGNAVEDPSNVANVLYNEASGGQKNMPVGPHLKGLNDGTGVGLTTNATTARSIRKGSIVAVYNTNSTTTYAITFGDASTVVAQTSGAIDGNGNPGIPCKPLDWTYLSAYEKSWVISENAALLVFLMQDESYITSQG